MSPRIAPLALILTLCWSALAAAQTQADLSACRGIAESLDRLACYDRLVGLQGMVALPASAADKPADKPGDKPALKSTLQSAKQPDDKPSDQAAGAIQTPEATPGATPPGSFLARYWELGPEDKRGTFNYTAYRPNYFLPLRAMRAVNNRPQTPTRGEATDLPHYQRGETKLQLSMRTKVLEHAFLPNADLWVAYTQQSMWQFWNRHESAPFRNTDFQPELIYVVPPPSALRPLPMGWRWQMAQFGLVHQSNGQSGALSRSWNRIYGAVGLEKGDVIAQVRLEQRLEKTGGHSDDNPNIVDYMGRVETQLIWSPGRATAALLWRPSLQGRGQVQLDWTYPVYNDHPDGLRWYVQLFQGFGESLLDYNFKQTSVGLGLTLFKF